MDTRHGSPGAREVVIDTFPLVAVVLINALCDRIDALEAENADLRAKPCIPGWGSEQLTADDNYYADPAPPPIPPHE